MMARDDLSGWTWTLRELSDFNFNRLNPEISGAPIYFNGDRVWPKPAPGITLISSSSTAWLPDTREP